MAKGDPSGIFTPVPYDGDDLSQFVMHYNNEMTRLAATFELALAKSVEFLNVAPSKPREGMVYGADGTNWNPGGGGQGVYCYYNGDWRRLG